MSTAKRTQYCEYKNFRFQRLPFAWISDFAYFLWNLNNKFEPSGGASVVTITLGPLLIALIDLMSATLPALTSSKDPLSLEKYFWD